jgi:NADH-quinone oxidoreductase subunit I
VEAPAAPEPTQAPAAVETPAAAPAAGQAPEASPEPQGGAPDGGGEHLEVEIDQATFDRLIAAGESERTARAKAKAAYARKLRAQQRGES